MFVVYQDEEEIGEAMVCQLRRMAKNIDAIVYRGY